MTRLVVILTGALLLAACDGTNRDRLTDEQATAEAAGPEADNIDINVAAEADALNRADDAASNDFLDPTGAYGPEPTAIAAKSGSDSKGPSFQCSGLISRVEELICSNPDLARSDRKVADEFSRAMAAASPDQKDRLRVIGRRYLADRNECQDAGCVMEAYRWYARDIDGLMGWPTVL